MVQKMVRKNGSKIVQKIVKKIVQGPNGPVDILPHALGRPRTSGMKAKLVTPFTSWINFILTTRPWIYLVLSIHFAFVLLQTQLQSERMYFIIRRQSFFYQFSQVTFVEKKVGTRDPSRQKQRFRHDRAYESLFAAFHFYNSDSDKEDNVQATRKRRPRTEATGRIFFYCALSLEERFLWETFRSS